MTEKLYLDDSYKTEFDAKVIKVSGDYVVLDKTCFYPKGGGQPHDTGIIEDQEGNRYRVVYAIKKDGHVSHEVSNHELKEGMKVHGKIDWLRRYKLMKYHTASHVLSAVVYNELNAKITGNKIDTDRLRVDYNMDEFDTDLFKEIIRKTNEELNKGHTVSISYMDRDEVLNRPDMVKLENAVPPNVEKLRIVQIGDVDMQPDGGTHVNNTKEIGNLSFIKAKNKGSNNRRVYLKLDE